MKKQLLATLMIGLIALSAFCIEWNVDEIGTEHEDKEVEEFFTQTRSMTPSSEMIL